MSKRILYLCLTLLIFIFYSCKTQYRIQGYIFVSKSSLVDTCSHMTISSRNNNSIILINDTTINYSISFGGLGVSTTIEYILSDSILIIDTVDIYNRSSFQEITNDIFGHKFYYFKDSLIDINRRDLYYSERLIQKEYNPNKSSTIYIIVNDKKYKNNWFNRRRLKSVFNSEKYTLKNVCNKQAKENMVLI